MPYIRFRIEKLAGSIKIYEAVLESFPQILTQWGAVAADAWKSNAWTPNNSLSALQIFSITTSTLTVLKAVVSYVDTNREHWFSSTCPRGATLFLLYLFTLTGVLSATMQFRFFIPSISEFLVSNFVAVFFGIFALCVKDYSVLRTRWWRILRSTVHSVLMIFAIFAILLSFWGKGLVEATYTDSDTIIAYGGSYFHFDFDQLKRVNATRTFIMTIFCCFSHLFLGLLIFPFEHARAEMFSPLINISTAAMNRLKGIWARKKRRDLNVRFWRKRFKGAEVDEEKAEQIDAEVADRAKGEATVEIVYEAEGEAKERPAEKLEADGSDGARDADTVKVDVIREEAKEAKVVGVDTDGMEDVAAERVVGKESEAIDVDGVEEEAKETGIEEVKVHEVGVDQVKAQEAGVKKAEKARLEKRKEVAVVAEAKEVEEEEVGKKEVDVGGLVMGKAATEEVEVNRSPKGNMWSAIPVALL